MSCPRVAELRACAITCEMTQLFSAKSDTYLRVALLTGPLFMLGLIFVASEHCEPDYITRRGWAPAQPVPFSHEHHAGSMGIDCRYCHSSAEVSPSAGIPPTHTCMTCHSQVWSDAQMLEPVRESFAQDKPIRWNRVYKLPEFVHFRHQNHVAAGVGCQSCHGRVDQMPLTSQAVSLKMKWCLDCHRDPAPHLRPPAEVFNMNWEPPDDPGARESLAVELMSARRINTDILTDCSTCHF